MKVLHLASEYPPQRVFGLGRFVRDLAEEQARQDHNVTVITNSIGGDLHESEQGGVRVLRIHHPPPPKPPQTSGCVMVFNILLLRRALDLAKRELSQFDVVCSHDWLTAPAAQAIRETFGPPHVCTFHDTIVGKRLGRLDNEVDRFSADAERWAARSATHVIANSAATKAELSETYDTDLARISVVPCAIAPGTFPVTDDPVRLAAFRETFASEDEVLVLYVGRLDPEKGVTILLNAFAKAGIRNARLCIVGAGALLEDLKARAKSLVVGDRTQFPGYVENPALAHLYRCADMLVCPSLYEPFGMVALEGMLQGTPAIVSDTGGLKELVEHGSTGIVVPPGDVDALANALGGLSADRAARERMGSAARETVLEERTWLEACRRTTKVYRTLSGSPRKPSSARRKKHLFVASDLSPGKGYSSGRLSRRLLESVRAKDDGIASITAGDVEIPPLRSTDGQEGMILHALQMATKLLAYSSQPPERIACSHWDGALAASVLKGLKKTPSVRYYCHKVGDAHRQADEAEAFEREMRLWAARESDDVHVPDEATAHALEVQSVKAAVSAFPPSELASARLADAATFRASFAEPDERLAVVALRLEPPFWGEAFLEVAEVAARARLPLRWVVCGDGRLLADLRKRARDRGLPISFTGHLPDTTLSAVLSVADLAVIPFKKARYTPFIDEAVAFSLPVLAPLGTAVLPDGSGSRVEEVDLSRLAEVVQKLATLLDLSVPRLSEKRQAGLRGAQARRAPTPRAAVDGTPREVVLYNDWGIGDELLLSAVAREIKRDHPETRVWIRSRFGFRFPEFCEPTPVPDSARRVETIYQDLALFGPTHHAPFPGHLVQQMLDKVALDTGTQVSAQDVRPEVELTTSTEQRDPRLVVVHCKPSVRLPCKDWGFNRWGRLCELLHARGLRIVQVGAADEPELPHAEDRRGFPLADTPDLVAGAGLVVCLVGFFMHAAAAADTPAIVIYGGREHPAIDGYPGHIHVCSDPLPCRGRWGCHLAPDTECPHGMRCMEYLAPELVDGLVETVFVGSRGRVTA